LTARDPTRNEREAKGLSGFELKTESYTLELRHTFRLARGASDTRKNLLVELRHGGATGRGEAAPIARYGQNAETARSAVEQMAIRLDRMGWDPTCDRGAIIEVSDPDQPAATAAFEMAVWDLVGQRFDKPVWELIGAASDPAESARPNAVPQTSYTIGLDDPQTIVRKVKEAAGFASLKVKLGGPADREAITAVRSVTDVPIRVDANEAWTVEQAKREIEWLSGQGVELVEQPLPGDDLDGQRRLRRSSVLPIFADESVISGESIPDLAGAFDGINIKLMKCGGVDRALEMIELAREHTLGIMLGCMIESSLAITAASHLSPLVDFVDLDGALLVVNDPFAGAELVDGRVMPPSAPGLGVVPRTSLD